jgi:hypothetical protein
MEKQDRGEKPPRDKAPEVQRPSEATKDLSPEEHEGDKVKGGWAMG